MSSPKSGTPSAFSDIRVAGFRSFQMQTKIRRRGPFYHFLEMSVFMGIF